MRADPCANENNGKRQPPDQIVGDVYPSKSPRQFGAISGDAKTNRAEDLTHQTDEHDGPVTHWGVGGADIADAIHAYDHSKALPDEDRHGRRHSDKVKQAAGCEHNISAECQVI